MEDQITDSEYLANSYLFLAIDSFWTLSSLAICEKYIVLIQGGIRGSLAFNSMLKLSHFTNRYLSSKKPAIWSTNSEQESKYFYRARKHQGICGKHKNWIIRTVSPLACLTFLYEFASQPLICESIHLNVNFLHSTGSIFSIFKNAFSEELRKLDKCWFA